LEAQWLLESEEATNPQKKTEAKLQEVSK
jgi:hypothetical protein